MVISMVAGEASGDQLGAALIRAIRDKNPDTRFVGIGGPLMKAAGMDCWWDSAELSIMGLFEVINHIPRLLGLRRQLVNKLLQVKPAVFVGIDAPDFNLNVERKLKAQSIPVIHYVSPTVWAWRAGRVKTIARSTDRVLCLFPFEPGYYARQSVLADYTGHPLADQIAPGTGIGPARQELDIGETATCIALLPGSRISEVGKLTSPMLDAAAVLAKRKPGIRFLVPAASQLIREYIESELDRYPGLDCRVLVSSSKQAMAAADLVICASGTATLEVMLINRPMVVCYRLSAMTYTLAKWLRLVKSRYFALPNILASEALVPELLQHEVTGERIADEVTKWLEQPARRDALQERFRQLHEQLRIDAASTAARVVLKHISLER
ncbi:MAG: lipid-A-disaccharide synthase [Xanthomonadales bacterium]|nr:lipid-A-disaccharide synthase [Xanthomonadales bacterium]